MAPVEKKIMTSFADNLNIIGYESAKIEVRGLIMKSGKSHKGEGLQFMMNHLQRPIEYSLGIGDWLNDLSMIETAGIGVAMKNACDELKNKADVMTNYDNNHGGMVRFLADNLL
jgi:hypothetical protein